jgi:hypothetical protein
LSSLDKDLSVEAAMIFDVMPKFFLCQFISSISLRQYISTFLQITRINVGGIHQRLRTMPKNAQHVSMSFSYFSNCKAKQRIHFFETKFKLYVTIYFLPEFIQSKNILKVQLPNAAIYIIIIIIIDTIEFNLSQIKHQLIIG